MRQLKQPRSFSNERQTAMEFVLWKCTLCMIRRLITDPHPLEEEKSPESNAYREDVFVSGEA